MSLVELIVYLVIAGVCGAIARALAGGTGRGFIISVVPGFVGAFVGTWLARLRPASTCPRSSPSAFRCVSTSR